MNYRHAFHAGNFADCFKHALLVALIDALARKPAPFCVLDTHAGSGQYDLESETARRTGEADAGIRRLLAPDPMPSELERYLALVRSLGLYPGSPAIIRSLLRPQDRMVCCELHPDEAAALRRLFHRTPNVEVHLRSGWEALGALLPPKEKRGLVFIDPPFENRQEFATLASGLQTAHARFRNGVLAAWYPVKHMAPVRDFLANLKMSGMRDIIDIQMHLREPVDPERLNGCGLVVVNPPFQFEQQAQTLAGAVLARLRSDEAGAAVNVTRIADE